MTESELNGIGERLRQHAPATDAEHFMAAEISLLLIEVARLRDENAQLRPLLDKLQDSDLALEAARRERARCVAMADEMRRREEEKLKERGADDWLNGRIRVLAALAKKMEDTP